MSYIFSLQSLAHSYGIIYFRNGFKFHSRNSIKWKVNERRPPINVFMHQKYIYKYKFNFNVIYFYYAVHVHVMMQSYEYWHDLPRRSLLWGTTFEAWLLIWLAGSLPSGTIRNKVEPKMLGFYFITLWTLNFCSIYMARLAQWVRSINPLLIVNFHILNIWKFN
jgi:hypothetical protein